MAAISCLPWKRALKASWTDSWRAVAGPLNAAGGSLKAIAAYLNAIAGVPDYQRYLEHFRKHHPGQQPMSEREFFKWAIDERYGGGKLRRCC